MPKAVVRTAELAAVILTLMRSPSLKTLRMLSSSSAVRRRCSRDTAVIRGHEKAALHGICGRHFRS